MAEDAPCCDFCGSPYPQWGYPASNFIVPIAVGMPKWGSMGGWAACDVCHGLIDADEKEALTQYSIDEFAAHHGLDAAYRPVIVVHIRELHADFWSHRIGPAVAIEELVK